MIHTILHIESIDAESRSDITYHVTGSVRSVLRTYDTDSGKVLSAKPYNIGGISSNYKEALRLAIQSFVNSGIKADAISIEVPEPYYSLFKQLLNDDILRDMAVREVRQRAVSNRISKY